MGDKKEAYRAANEEMIIVFSKYQAEFIEVSQIQSDVCWNGHNEIFVVFTVFRNRSIAQLKINKNKFHVSFKEFQDILPLICLIAF